MLARMAIIFVAAMATAATAAPEQPKPVAESAQSDRPVTVLASADHVRAPTQPAESPKRPRAVRVTTCRCGDQLPETAEESKDR